MALAPSVIQIKRSQVTSTPPELAYGEQAYSEQSDTLFIGLSNGDVVAIGGLAAMIKLAGIEDNANNYQLPVATDSQLGGIKIGQGLTISAGSVSVDTSSYDNKSEVDAKIAAAINNLINGAGDAFDTLLELADAIQGNDADIAQILTNQAGKMDKSANLSDVDDVPTARANLGLGALALQDDIDGGTF